MKRIALLTLTAFTIAVAHGSDTSDFARVAAAAEQKFDTQAGHDYAIAFVQSAGKSLADAMRCMQWSDVHT